jgi:hypothetical protein
MDSETAVIDGAFDEVHIGLKPARPAELTKHVANYDVT